MQHDDTHAMLSRLSHSLLCTLVLFAVATPLSAHAQASGHPAASPTAISLTCTPLGSVSQGGPVSLVATISSSSGTPTGRVNFTQNGVSLAAVSLNNGAASLNAILYKGTNSFVATFPEQNDYAGSSATCNLQAGALRLNSNNNPALAYSSITFIADYTTQPFPGGDFTFSFNGGPPIEANGGGRNPAEAFYSTDTLTAGTYIVTVTFSPGDGSAPSSATITQVVTAATGDFTLTGYPPTFTVRDGITASGLIAATSVNDFHGPVSLSCSLPHTVDYTCTLTPASVQLLHNDYQTSTLTLAPSKPPVALSHQPGRGRGASGFFLASFLPLSFALFAAYRRQTPLRWLLCLGVLSLLAFSTTACGPDIFVVATPTGSYPVTITATGTTPGEDPITHTLNINLNITR